MNKKILCALLLFVCTSTSSDAALVVATCGTPPVAYTVGQVRQITVDTTGKICS